MSFQIYNKLRPTSKTQGSSVMESSRILVTAIVVCSLCSGFVYGQPITNGDCLNAAPVIFAETFFDSTFAGDSFVSGCGSSDLIENDLWYVYAPPLSLIHI